MFQRLQNLLNCGFYGLWCVCWWLYSQRDRSLSCNALMVIGWMVNNTLHKEYGVYSREMWYWSLIFIFCRGEIQPYNFMLSQNVKGERCLLYLSISTYHWILISVKYALVWNESIKQIWHILHSWEGPLSSSVRAEYKIYCKNILRCIFLIFSLKRVSWVWTLWLGWIFTSFLM